MTKTILSVNAGSSSVKINFYAMEKPPRAIADAEVSGITAPPQKLKYRTSTSEKKEELRESLNTPPAAFKFLLQRCLSDPELSEVASVEDLAYICHRVVHGGDYPDAIEINEETYHHLKMIEDLAPLHNYSALEIIRTCMQELVHVRNIAYFDSAFHKTLPKHVRTYPINQEIATTKGLRKYGFHGISYSFILRYVAEYLGKPQDSTTLIVLHLGSGASMCVIRDGKSIDTTLVFHYTSNASSLSPSSTTEMHISAAEEILNKQSGWKVLTGTTDFSQIAVESPPSENHKLAFDIVVDRISGFVGNYFVKVDGQVDAMVFAGGIGEKSALLRQAVVQQCRCLGFAIDATKNGQGAASKATVTEISKEPGRGPRVLICQTNEQFEMAYHTVNKSMKQDGL
ncbi:Acetate kinase [Rasamsonia emersonii CBS 393.64]|uniref:Probable acetate kinase n=1 Tax=Rasamsonia emersonii (strain ATCC 16479 / CBS 393.64 / IMI 116815) TaxID=1408163 RepID=A0A0F4YP84_RASE3|nr:Acetate kinase [Rasamsonia emersonii CBS 393.64]KKA19443.1 Acetate kinase [Rasamsonia emersonii CBS 393.64]